MKYFKHHFEVRFQELDPGGIMFFANLFNHAHDAYAALMADAGMSLKTILSSGRYLLPLVHAEAEYHHPLMLEDNIQVMIRPLSVKHSSFSFEYRFFREDICCATINTTHVFLQKSTNSATPIPGSLHQYLSNYLD
jgi:1,4-dihydroxy-2-naphthoyl-CoA hydrolase